MTFSPRIKTFTIISIIALSVCGALFQNTLPLQADTVSELQSKIDERNTDIKALEKEIAEYQKQLTTLGTQASSLSSTIKSLELTQKKLEADISVSQNKIAAKNLEIEQLSNQINDKEGTIEDNRRIIAQSFTTIGQLDDLSMLEMFLSSGSFSDIWSNLDHLEALQGGLREHIISLREVKAGLVTNRSSTEKAKAELLALQAKLNDQRKVVLATAGEKNALLKETKQSESSYKKLLADKKALKDAFEKEILNFESQLRLAVDSSLLPPTGSGVLSWPVESVLITQHFGNTEFATANSQIYNGKGHTGIDLRATVGTPLLAALSGTVVGVSNTDLVRGCYSYGKWVMIDHGNGLSTLYAHMSVQSVTKGQLVSTGEIIGYSGNTGYTTGPHLHFGVYATQGVQITTFDNSVNCKGATIPLADFKAYLNPLSYLPK